MPFPFPDEADVRILGDTRLRHADRVTGLNVDAAGRRIVSSSWDHTVRIWGLATGSLQRVLLGHEGSVRRAVFSPDGRLVASGATSGEVLVWEAESGKRVHRFEHATPVHDVAFTPDGTRLATGQGRFGQGTVQVWDLGTGERVWSKGGHEYAVQAVAFSPDGRMLVTGGLDKTIRGWHPETGVERKTMSRGVGQVNTLSFSPDGSRVAAADDDGAITVWDPRAATRSKRFRHSDYGEASASYLPDGRLVSAGRDGQFLLHELDTKLWEFKSTRRSEPIEAGGRLSSVAVTPDGRFVLTGSEAGRIRVWDVATGEEGISRSNEAGHDQPVGQVAFTENGDVISASRDGTIRIWTPEGRQRNVATDLDDACDRFEITPDGRYLVPDERYRENHAIGYRDTKTGREVRTFEGLVDFIDAIRLSADGTRLLGVDGFTAFVWDTTNGREVSRFDRGVEPGVSWSVRTAAMSPDAATAAIGVDDSVSLWKVAEGRPGPTLAGHEQDVRCIVYSPDGRWLASLADEVIVWDAATNERRHRMELEYGSNLVFSPDSRLLVAYGIGSLQIWETESGKRLHSGEDTICSVLFTSDSATLFATGEDGELRRFEARTGRLTSRVRIGPPETTNPSLALSPDGATLALANPDGTITLLPTHDWSSLDETVIAAGSSGTASPDASEAEESADGRQNSEDGSADATAEDDDPDVVLDEAGLRCSACECVVDTLTVKILKGRKLCPDCFESLKELEGESGAAVVVGAANGPRRSATEVVEPEEDYIANLTQPKAPRPSERPIQGPTTVCPECNTECHADTRNCPACGVLVQRVDRTMRTARRYSIGCLSVIAGILAAAGLTSYPDDEAKVTTHFGVAIFFAVVTAWGAAHLWRTRKRR